MGYKEILFLCMVAVGSCGNHRGRYLSREIVDLTHPFNEHARYHPLYGPSSRFQYKMENNVTARNLTFFAGNYKGIEHSGTHIDAPFHLNPNGAKVDKIPLEQLVAPASVIHLGHKTNSNHTYEMTVQDILDWEASTGRTIDNTIMIVDFDWSKYYKDIGLYFTGKIGGLGLYNNDTSKMSFPAVGGDAAYWIIKNRPGVKGLMVDLMNPDGVTDKPFPVHQAFLYTGKFIVENLGGDITSLPEYIPEVMVLPMKIEGGTGGPVRIIARYWKWRYY